MELLGRRLKIKIKEISFHPENHNERKIQYKEHETTHLKNPHNLEKAHDPHNLEKAHDPHSLEKAHDPHKLEKAHDFECAYEYEFKKANFKDNFNVDLTVLHSILFGSIKISLFKRTGYFKTKKCVGVASLRINALSKEILNMTKRKENNIILEAKSKHIYAIKERYDDNKDHGINDDNKEYAIKDINDEIDLLSMKDHGIDDDNNEYAINDDNNEYTIKDDNNEYAIKDLLSKKEYAINDDKIDLLSKNEFIVFKRSKTNIRLFVNIRPSKEINLSEYYNRKGSSLGYLELEIDINKISENVSVSTAKKNPIIDQKGKDASNSQYLFKFSVLLQRFFNKPISNIFLLMFSIQSGSLACKIRAMIGFLIIQIFSRNKPLSLENTIKTTISKKRASEALTALQYSCAAYMEFPVRIFIPCKIRDVKVQNISIKHILDRAMINESDIVRINNGKNGSISYCSFFDLSNRLVISFRGTSKPEDILKVCDSCYVPFLDGFAHEGMYRLAFDFVKIELPKLLEALNKKNQKNSKKKIFLTGHSMGGAVANLVYLICMNLSAFKNEINLNIKKINFRVIAFSVPPIVSLELANRKCKDVTIFNYEDDIIPRLSYGSILDFKYLCISLGSLLFKAKRSDLEEIREYLIKLNVNEKLYCPGEIYHIKSIKDGYVFKKVSPLCFNTIKLSFRFIYDHLMIHIYNALMGVLK